MCRNIRQLFNFEPPATADEIRAASIQFVRKVSGTTRPSASNQEAFERAVDEIAAITARLLGELTTAAPPKNRDDERERQKARWNKRVARIVRD